jgi:phosphoenolpyruvate-protein phosphotransferase
MLRRISEIIAQTTDPRSGLRLMAQCIAEQVGSLACGIFVYRKETDELVLMAAHGLDALRLENWSFSADSGLAGLAVRTDTTVNVADRHQHPAYYPMPNAADAILHGSLAVPLVVGGTTIGALALARKEKRRFSKQIVGQAEALAPSLAIFILHTLMASQNNNELRGVIPFQTMRPTQETAYPCDESLTGRPITQGVALGTAMLFSGVDELFTERGDMPPQRLDPEEAQREKQLFQSALEVARRTSKKTAREMSQVLEEVDNAIFEMHVTLLDDPVLQSRILGHLQNGMTLTAALGETLAYFNQQYMRIEDQYLRERLADIKDVLLRIKNAADNLRDDTVTSEAGLYSARHVVLCARELLPSQLVSIPRSNIYGILCEHGGTTCHTAILARALQIPMLVDVTGLLNKVRSGDNVLIDCNAGRCYLRPTDDLVKQFREPLRLAHRHRKRKAESPMPMSEETITPDGGKIRFAGNISLLSEMPALRHYGIPEIGLYRTEFLFMIRNSLPSEDEQFDVFKRMMDAADGIPVTFRVMDAGGDKPLPYLNIGQEDNPALGWRGLRFMLSNPDILHPHLRAILRASAYGKVSIMLPMVADVYDLNQAKEAFKAAEDDLIRRGIPFDRNYRLGIMLEIPSAFLGLKPLLPHVDFVSIGTNDMVQFLFAVDRGNNRVIKWFRQCHPIVLRLLKDVCQQVAAYPDKSVTLCGELAGSERALPLLLGAGLRHLSMTPHRVPIIRARAEKLNIAECEDLLERVLATCESEMDVARMLDDMHGRT